MTPPRSAKTKSIALDTPASIRPITALGKENPNAVIADDAAASSLPALPDKPVKIETPAVEKVDEIKINEYEIMEKMIANLPFPLEVLQRSLHKISSGHNNSDMVYKKLSLPVY
jgi:propanediol dehydratase large subunit